MQFNLSLKQIVDYAASALVVGSLVGGLIAGDALDENIPTKNLLGNLIKYNPGLTFQYDPKDKVFYGTNRSGQVIMVTQWASAAQRLHRTDQVTQWQKSTDGKTWTDFEVKGITGLLPSGYPTNFSVPTPYIPTPRLEHEGHIPFVSFPFVEKKIQI